MSVNTYTWMSAPDITSDAAFRKWAQGIRDAFVACGWVQTADTGQLDPTTATVPATNTTAAGYMVFALADTLQATAPVLVKVEVGKGAGTSVPCIWITVGQATNGAGTLSALLLARTQHNSSNNGATNEYASYASGDGSSICLSLWGTLSLSTGFMLVVERSRDAAGSATGAGFLIVFGASSGPTVRVIANGGTIDASRCASGRVVGVMPSNINGVNAGVGSTLSKDGVTAPVLPVPCMAPGLAPWTSNVLAIVHPGDAGATSVIQAATINGQTRTYRASPFFDPNAGTVAVINPNSASVTAFFRPAIAWAV